jgi:adenylate cyclase
MAVFGQPDPKPDDAERALHCALRLSEELARWRGQRQREDRAALDAGIGLHIGPVIGGIVESGQHDEFTVFGDAVNVAQRLDRLSKSLGASLVVSASLISKVPSAQKAAAWVWKDGIELVGRTGALEITYLPRLTEGRIAQEQSLHAQIARARR